MIFKMFLACLVTVDQLKYLTRYTFRYPWKLGKSHTVYFLSIFTTFEAHPILKNNLKSSLRVSVRIHSWKLRRLYSRSMDLLKKISNCLYQRIGTEILKLQKKRISHIIFTIADHGCVTPICGCDTTAWVTHLC